MSEVPPKPGKPRAGEKTAETVQDKVPDTVPDNVPDKEPREAKVELRKNAFVCRFCGQINEIREGS